MFFEENKKLSETKSDNVNIGKEDLFEKYGFEDLPHKKLKRVESIQNSYMVYSDPMHFERIILESIIHAIHEGTIKSPYKIINIHSRMPDILIAEHLEEEAENNIAKTSENNMVADTQQTSENPQETPSEMAETTPDATAEQAAQPVEEPSPEKEAETDESQGQS